MQVSHRRGGGGCGMARRQFKPAIGLACNRLHLPKGDHLVVELVQLLQAHDPKQPSAQESVDCRLWRVLVELLDAGLTFQGDPPKTGTDPSNVDVHWKVLPGRAPP